MLGLLLTALALGIAGVTGYAGYRYNRAVHAWETARPLETEIDLSQPGAVTVPFEQTCSVSHGEGLFLDCDLRGDTGQVPENVLEGLVGFLVITNAAGEEIVRRSLMDDEDDEDDVQPDEPIVYRYLASGEIMLVNLPTFAAGTYSATITVDQPAPALAGHRQTVYARYQLCGLEQMSVVMFGFVAFCAGFVTLVIGSFTVPAFCREGIWKKIVVEQAPSVESAKTVAESTGEEPPRELFF
jgi:hypothetical protein